MAELATLKDFSQKKKESVHPKLESFRRPCKVAKDPLVWMMVTTYGAIIQRAHIHVDHSINIVDSKKVSMNHFTHNSKVHTYTK